MGFHGIAVIMKCQQDLQLAYLSLPLAAGCHGEDLLKCHQHVDTQLLVASRSKLFSVGDQSAIGNSESTHRDTMKITHTGTSM